MRIAIMGAGLSGLSCAIELEKHGVMPDIFEARSLVGDRFVNGEIFLELTSRPALDCITYMSNELGISLHPVHMLRTITIFGPTEKAVVNGSIGHSNIRGRQENSTENHLSKELKSPIRFHSTATYEELLKEYTHVVVATGDSEDARRLRNFDEALSVCMKGATVEGAFDLQTVYTWLSDEYSPKGYSYLIPMSEKEASMVIVYPEYPETVKLDIHKLWDAFFERASRDMQQQLRVTDRFEINHYVIGICKNSRIGNTFFVGNNFGTIMPFLGFGQFNSIATGVYAARDICGEENYEDLTRPLRKSFSNSLVLRRSMEQIGNDQLDTIVKWLATPIGNRLFQSRRTDVLRLVSYLLRPWLRIKTMI